jgi:hypothetical protein
MEYILQNVPDYTETAIRAKTENGNRLMLKIEINKLKEA